ncbi:hypothetical protein TRIATDRAFT_299714 [Trichoderma atroviride IMI 206040]|uniref:Uncharacterized protein n=1 Tax=Hypocrea atroviridis (strain ATCC 20476 / IMI 206040) TaxID=452589 RepID=G9NV72_HYPAI|nr:uncharacterized protein TRIATDRAFT_299714 [Trichoderma atroviride IMI 206040]EHK44893.1 hypothetical protein TRIATDRAFT_299714 [Trichoderma atroviride IMI 206040]
MVEISHVTNINCLTNHSLQSLKPRKAAQLKMFKRSLHDCEKSSSSTTFIPLQLNPPLLWTRCQRMILLDCSITSIPPHSDTLHRNMFPTPQMMHVIQAYKRLLVSKEELSSVPNIPTIFVYDKELQSQGMAERLLAQRYIAQKCILIRMPGR